MFSLNRIAPYHPMGKHTLLYGGTVAAHPKIVADSGQWDDAGQIRYAQTLVFNRSHTYVVALKVDESGGLSVCPSCRQCVPTVFVNKPSVVLKDSAPLWARLWFAWWKRTGRVTA